MDRLREQIERHRRTRRRVLAGALTGGAGLIVAGVGCGSTKSSKSGAPAQAPASGATSAAQPKRGGSITHEAYHEADSTPMDPHTNNTVVGRNLGFFYQRLLGADFRTYEVQPQLAAKWELPDQTTYIFTLQPGVKWQNKPPVSGRAMTVDDVVYSVNRMRTNDPRFIARSLLYSVDAVSAPDAKTVKITTKQPDVSQLAKLSGYPAAIVAPEVMDKGGKFQTAEEAVGTGAFIMQSREVGVGADFVRNPDYWKPGQPYLDRVHTAQFASDNLAYAGFQAGQVDICSLDGPSAKDFIGKLRPGVTPDWFKEDTLPAIFPNVKAKPFDDARVSRAAKLLIDHEEFRTAWATVWHGNPGRNGSILPTALEGWDLSHDEYAKLLEWKQPKDDAVKEAMQLLSAAGFTKDNPLKFEMLCWSDVAFFVPANQLLQDQWKRFSQGVVTASLRAVPVAQSYAERASRHYTYFIGGNSASTTEPDAWLTEGYRTGGSQNYMDYSDPKLDAMIDKQRATFDTQQRRAVIRDLVTYAVDNCPLTSPTNRLFLNATKPQLQGYAPEFGLNGAEYEQVWLQT